MNFFDSGILHLVNTLAGRSAFFDQALLYLTGYDLCKGVVVLATFWWVWFSTRNPSRQFQLLALCTLVAGVVSSPIARLLAAALPFRPRPILEPALHLHSPDGMTDASGWETWSSFPSDHAALFFSIGWGILRLDRRLGLWLIGYIVLVICLPRLYLGLHYPTDLIAGALLGVGVSYLSTCPPVQTTIGSALLKWLERFPGFFYASLFVVTYNLATLFYDLRGLLWAIRYAGR